jgi:phytol kinase
VWRSPDVSVGEPTASVGFGSFEVYTHTVGVWRSWLARVVRDDEVGGSSPLTPTISRLYSVSWVTILLMLLLAISLFVDWLVLLLVEWLTKKKIISSEVSRKIPHILTGIIAACLPFFVTMKTIAVVGIVILIAALVMRRLNLFALSRAADRLTWGELFFALAITICALINPSEWVFTAGILYLALGDSVAALIGKPFGKHRYKIFGNKKSLEGSIAFMIVAMAITYWVIYIAPSHLHAAWPIIVWLPLLGAVVEAVLPFGLDNLLLPIVIVVVLNMLRVTG